MNLALSSKIDARSANKVRTLIKLIAEEYPGTVSYHVTLNQIELMNEFDNVIAYMPHAKLINYWEVVNGL